MTDTNPNEPFVTITQSATDEYTYEVRHSMFPHVERVDLSPEPTWPSPVEANDMLGDAVVKVLDAAWKDATGQDIERDNAEIGRTLANSKAYLANALTRLSLDDFMEVLNSALSGHPDTTYGGRSGVEVWGVGEYSLTITDDED